MAEVGPREFSVIRPIGINIKVLYNHRHGPSFSIAPGGSRVVVPDRHIQRRITLPFLELLPVSKASVSTVRSDSLRRDFNASSRNIYGHPPRPV